MFAYHIIRCSFGGSDSNLSAGRSLVDPKANQAYFFFGELYFARRHGLGSYFVDQQTFVRGTWHDCASRFAAFQDGIASP